MPSPLSNDDVDAIQAELFGGNKIQAIKLYRERTGHGLKESKDFIDSLDGELRRNSPEKFTAKSGCVGMLLGVATLIAIVVYRAAVA